MFRLLAPIVARPMTASGTAIGVHGALASRLRGVAGRPSLVVGTIVLISASIAAVFSLQIVRYEPDEIGYTHLAIGIARSLSPFTLSYGGAQRVNQLYPLLIAPIWGVFGNVSAFRIAHAWNALLMASAAIPSYLLAREVVQRRWPAYLAAALVAVAPWLTLATTQLTEVAAFPACVWALLAMQRSLAAPSPRRDLIALVAIAVASYGRLQLIVLAPVLVLAMLLHELGYGVGARGDRRAGLRKAVKRVTRGHALLSAVAVVGLFVGVPLLLSGKLTSAAGFYGDTVTGATINGATFDLARSYFSFIALGLGALPAALAIGFALETVIVPVSRCVHAFTSIAIVTVLALTLQVAEVSVRFNSATLQERYLFYIAPLLIVGMCAALLFTRHPLKMVLGGSIVLAILIGTTHHQSARTAFWYQVSPGMTSFYDWVRPVFGAPAGPTADPGASRQVLAGVIVFALGLLVAVLARRVSPSRLLAGVGTVAILFCGAETVHALWQVVHGNSDGIGFGSGSLRDVDWVDRNVPSGAPVRQIVGNVGGLDRARGLWEGDELWNRSIVGAYSFGAFADPYLTTTKLSLSARSGALVEGQGGSTGSAPQARLARYVVIAARGFPIEPVGVVLARSPDGVMDLMRASVPLRAAWSVSGISPDGWLALYRGATLRLYMLRGKPGLCARVGITLSLSSVLSSDRTLALRAGGVERNVRFQPGDTRTVNARVCGRTGAAPLLRIRSRQSAAAADPQLTLQLQRVTVTPV